VVSARKKEMCYHVGVPTVITELMKFIEGNHEKKMGWGFLKELLKNW
jgi:hypothetical protein